jgi:hypothetical protein
MSPELGRFFDDLSNILIFVIINRDISTLNRIEETINDILISAREKLSRLIVMDEDAREEGKDTDIGGVQE